MKELGGVLRLTGSLEAEDLRDWVRLEWMSMSMAMKSGGQG